MAAITRICCSPGKHDAVFQFRRTCSRRCFFYTWRSFRELEERDAEIKFNRTLFCEYAASTLLLHRFPTAYIYSLR